MRILHIITGLDTGGAERSLFNLLGSRLREDFEHHVLSLSGLGHYGGPLREMGITVHALDLRSIGGLLNGLVQLRGLVKEIAPDLVQGWMYHGNMMASASRMVSKRVPVAWNVRQSLYDIGTERRTTQWLIKALKAMSRGPKAIIYNSFQSREHHQAFGFAAGNGMVIPNGFDTERWRPDSGYRSAFRNAIGVTDAEPVVGFVGRLHRQKDVPTFLRACSIATADNPRLHVVIVGDGLTRDNPALAECYADIPTERLHALGSQQHIETILPGFDVFCLSSSSEAFPNVLGEAMACGLPCIATDVGDCGRLLNGRGQIVAARNFEQMADAIKVLANLGTEHRVQMGEAARARIISAYGLDSTVTAYARLYRSMIKDEKLSDG